MQVVCDAHTGMILAGTVSNDPTDCRHLPGLISQLSNNSGFLPSAFVADKGYDTAANAYALEQAGITSYLHPKRGMLPFWQLDSTNRLCCPGGYSLHPESTFSKRGVPVQRLIIKQCPTCVHRSSCGVPARKKFTHPVGVDPLAHYRNEVRCRSPQGQQILRERGRIVECLFARWKGNGGFRRFRLRGLEGVQTECHWEWLALNVKALIRLGLGGSGGSLGLQKGVSGVLGHYVRVLVCHLGCLVRLRGVLAGFGLFVGSPAMLGA